MADQSFKMMMSFLLATCMRNYRYLKCASKSLWNSDTSFKTVKGLDRKYSAILQAR